MPQAPQTQQPQGGLAKAMPGQAAVADQFQNQAKPFGWLMDMISHITGTLQPPQKPGQGQPMDEKVQKPPKDKQSQDAGQTGQPGQPGQVPGGMIDPAGVQQLVSLFQPNALSNLGLLPQQQGNWNWVLSMMQQQQAAQAQQKGIGGNDLISVIRQMGGAGGSMVPGAEGAASGATAGAGTAAAGAAKAVVGG